MAAKPPRDLCPDAAFGLWGVLTWVPRQAEPEAGSGWLTWQQPPRQRGEGGGPLGGEVGLSALLQQTESVTRKVTSEAPRMSPTISHLPLQRGTLQACWCRIGATWTVSPAPPPSSIGSGRGGARGQGRVRDSSTFRHTEEQTELVCCNVPERHWRDPSPIS